MGTQDNLGEAFAGESQASRKYLAFAEKAERDGKPQIAKLFRAASAAETVHAHAHLRAMKGIGTTEENLQVAIDGEAYEFTTMYPDFLKVAEEEGHRSAINSMKNAMAAEKIHHQLYTEAMETLKAGNDLAANDIWVCNVCGHTTWGDAPDVCPICGAKHDRFFKVD